MDLGPGTVGVLALSSAATSIGIGEVTSFNVVGKCTAAVVEVEVEVEVED